MLQPKTCSKCKLLTSDNGVDFIGREISEESVLNQKVRAVAVPDLPEKLITASQVAKKTKSTDVNNIQMVLIAVYLTTKKTFSVSSRPGYYFFFSCS